MSKCEVCENEYDKAFTVTMSGRQHVFDCFECAVHALAPQCPCCSCRIIGHGVEADDEVYCCAHCARTAGVLEITDRVEHALPDSSR